MNQFLSTFTSEVFSYVLDIIQIKESTFHLTVLISVSAKKLR